MARSVVVAVAAAAELPVIGIGHLFPTYRPRSNGPLAEACEAGPVHADHPAAAIAAAAAAAQVVSVLDLNGGGARDNAILNYRNEDGQIDQEQANPAVAAEKEASVPNVNDGGEHVFLSDGNGGRRMDLEQDVAGGWGNDDAPAVAAAPQALSGEHTTLQVDDGEKQSSSSSQKKRSRPSNNATVTNHGTGRSNKKRKQMPWNERLEQLKAYKEDYSPNPSLGRWVGKQRAAYRHSKDAKERGTTLSPDVARISDDRICPLEAISFEWSLPDLYNHISGNDRIDQLRAYKEEHDDCRVPKIYLPSTSLGHWVQKQRKAYRPLAHAKKHGTTLSPGIFSISDGRISQLEAIGFEW